MPTLNTWRRWRRGLDCLSPLDTRMSKLSSLPAGRRWRKRRAEVRYSFLADVCQNVGARLIVTGHTRSDHAETILLHILRGSGTRGLVGLKPLTPRIIDDAEVIIVRPMLDITREETASYCQQVGSRSEA